MNIPGAMPIPTDETFATALSDVLEELTGKGLAKFTAAQQAEAVKTLKWALGIEAE